MIIALAVLLSVVFIVASYLAGRTSGVDAVEKDQSEATVKAMEVRNEVESNIHELDLASKRDRLRDDSE